MNMSFITRL